MEKKKESRNEISFYTHAHTDAHTQTHRNTHKAHLPYRKYMKLTRKLQARGDGNRNTRVWRLQKGELWKFILRNDVSFWKPKPANWFHCSCSSRSLSCCCCCYFPSSTKLTHISTKTIVLLHPRIPCSSVAFVFLCRASLQSISILFLCACEERVCVCAALQ